MVTGAQPVGATHTRPWYENWGEKERPWPKRNKSRFSPLPQVFFFLSFLVTSRPVNSRRANNDWRHRIHQLKLFLFHQRGRMRQKKREWIASFRARDVPSLQESRRLSTEKRRRRRKPILFLFFFFFFIPPPGLVCLRYEIASPIYI